MLCARCIRSLLRRPVLPGPSLNRIAKSNNLQPTRSISLLSLRRPQLQPSPPQSALTTTTLDLVPKISKHPILASIQVRNGPRNTYNMTHKVRKRRHGFLSRIRTRKGRALLRRRKAKGRWNLSH